MFFAGLLELGAHVHQLDFRQRALLDALRQLEQCVLAALRVVEGLHRRRGRAQHHRRAAELAAHHGHVAAVVARHLFLLVGAVLLFVHHDQGEVAHRREHRRARPHDHARIAVADAVPLLGPLGIGERGVQDRDLVSENLMQVGGGLRRQADLRHQQDRRPAGGEHVLHGRQVHRRLARAGDAEQQRDREPLLFDPFANLFESRRLRRVEREVERGLAFKTRNGKLRRLFEDVHDAAPRQRRQRGLRHLEAAQMFHRSASAGRGQSLHDPLLIRIELAADFFQLNDAARAPGIARAGNILGGDPSLAHQPGQQLAAGAKGGAQRLFARAVAGGQVVEHAVFEHLLVGALLGSPRGSPLCRFVQRRPSRLGDAERPRALHLRAQRQHGAEDLAERRQVVVGDPFAQAHQLGIEHGCGVEDFKDVLGLDRWRAIMQRGHHARQPQVAEGHQHASADHRLRPVQPIGETGLQRHRQRDIAELRHGRKINLTTEDTGYRVPSTQYQVPSKRSLGVPARLQPQVLHHHLQVFPGLFFLARDRAGETRDGR